MGLLSRQVLGGKIERRKADITGNFAQMAAKILKPHHQHLDRTEIAMHEPALAELRQRTDVDVKEGHELSLKPGQWCQSGCNALCNEWLGWVKFHCKRQC